MKKQLNDWKFWGLVSLTLGLAPFFPEPHIWGKLRWIAGGAVGMQPMDWFDTLMHGLPWILFIRAVAVSITTASKSSPES
jgi:hypothetical protein